VVYQTGKSMSYYDIQVASEPDNKYTPSPIGPVEPAGPVGPVAPVIVAFGPAGPCGPRIFTATLAVFIVAAKNDAEATKLADVTFPASGGIPNGYDCILVGGKWTVYSTDGTSWPDWSLWSCWTGYIYTRSCRPY
jgi:hypothetical protein